MILDENGEQQFYRSVYDMETNESLEEMMIEPDTALLDDLQSAIEETELQALCNSLESEYDPRIEHKSGDFVDIAIEYQNGRRLTLQVAEKEITDDCFWVCDRLKAHLDSLFES